MVGRMLQRRWYNRTREGERPRQSAVEDGGTAAMAPHRGEERGVAGEGARRA